jgi:hypothetical protein
VLPIDIKLPRVKAIANFLGMRRNTETAKKLKKKPIAKQVAKPISLLVRESESSSVKLSTKDLGGSGSLLPISLHRASDCAMRVLPHQCISFNRKNYVPLQRFSCFLGSVSNI